MTINTCGYSTSPFLRSIADRQLSAQSSFIALLCGFSLLTLLSWPILFSMDLWIFKDRGSFLNLDYLLQDGQRLGVNSYYAYGLLPVLVQHVMFSLSGRGYKPMLGAGLVGLVLLALIWSRLAQRMSQRLIWMAGILAASPIIAWVNPNFPYLLVTLSTLLALYLILQGRLDLALAAAVVGCLSVPSIPLVLAAIIVLAIFINWATNRNRQLGALILDLFPGLAAYLILATILILYFGIDSFIACALPVQGIRHYRAMGFGVSSLGEFLFPHRGFLFYVGYRASWWMLSTLALGMFGAYALVAMVRSRKLVPEMLFIFVCTAIHLVVVLIAYGPPGQHVIYDPILLAGVLGGIAFVPLGGWRWWLFGTFILVGALGSVGQVRDTIKAWQSETTARESAGLYADRDWLREWCEIVHTSNETSVFLLSYATAAHHYFPTIQSPHLWTLMPGQVLNGEKSELLAKLNAAEIVVVDLRSSTSFVDLDVDIQARLARMRLSTATSNFQIWRRSTPRAN